jgi:hypothetical protein
VLLSHPIFSFVTDTSEAAGDLDLGATRTRRMFLLEPDPRRGADIAVAFTSGAPALLTRAHGQGRVALLTTSVDRDWGDLPLRPGFVPLAVQTITYLAGTRDQSSSSVIAVGARKQLARASSYSVTTPAGASVPITPREGEAAVFDGTDAPGHYRASVGSEEQVERFVVEFDAREADTTPVTIAGATTSEGGGTVKIYEPRWRELALVVLLLLGLESGARLWATRSRTQVS